MLRKIEKKRGRNRKREEVKVESYLRIIGEPKLPSVFLQIYSPGLDSAPLRWVNFANGLLLLHFVIACSLDNYHVAEDYIMKVRCWTRSSEVQSGR